MLPFPAFDLEMPRRLDEVLALAATPDSRLLAGGTDLLPSMKHRLFRPDLLISLTNVAELSGIREEAGGLVIGATTTLSQVARDPRVQARYPALVDACRGVATPTIQGMGTLGGNVLLDTRCLYYNQPAGWRAAIGGCLKAEGSVCHVARAGTGCYAASSADTVPALWLYGARLRLASKAGVREIALSGLYAEDGRDVTRLLPGELLVELLLPPPEAPVVHRKLRLRGAIDYGLLLVAVRREGRGARAVLSALGPRPLEIVAEDAADLPELGWVAAKPLGTHAAPATWRKAMVRVELRRALAAFPR